MQWRGEEIKLAAKKRSRVAQHESPLLDYYLSEKTGEVSTRVAETHRPGSAPPELSSAAEEMPRSPVEQADIHDDQTLQYGKDCLLAHGKVL